MSACVGNLKVTVSLPLGCRCVFEVWIRGWALQLQFLITMEFVLKKQTETLLILVYQWRNVLFSPERTTAWWNCRQRIFLYFLSLFIQHPLCCVGTSCWVKAEAHRRTTRPWQLRIEPTIFTWTEFSLVIPLASHANSRLPVDWESAHY